MKLDCYGYLAIFANWWFLKFHCIYTYSKNTETCRGIRNRTSLSPSVSSRRRRMVLKCSSHTAMLSSRVIFSSSTRAPLRSSERSLWLDSSLSRSATRSEWSWPTAQQGRTGRSYTRAIKLKTLCLDPKNLILMSKETIALYNCARIRLIHL